MTCIGISSCTAPAASFSKGLFWTGCQGRRAQSSMSPLCDSIAVRIACSFPKSLSRVQSPSQARKQLKHLLSLSKPDDGLVLLLTRCRGNQTGKSKSWWLLCATSHLPEFAPLSLPTSLPRPGCWLGAARV